MTGDTQARKPPAHRDRRGPSLSKADRGLRCFQQAVGTQLLRPLQVGARPPLDRSRKHPWWLTDCHPRAGIQLLSRLGLRPKQVCKTNHKNSQDNTGPDRRDE